MTDRPLDVLCLGEALVDLLPERRGRLRDCERFSVHSGGAPANVAVGLARLGSPVGFAGVLGDDEFGRLLERKLQEEGVETHLRFTRESPTGAWFIALDEGGNRSFFSPSGAFSADKRVGPADVGRAPLRSARWLHCGSSSHVLPEGQEALLAAVRAAEMCDTRVSFDPNVRPHLWTDPGELRRLCLAAIPRCDLVKLSDEECEAALGEPDPERAAARLAGMGVPLACITLGARGALLRRGHDVVRAPAPAVEVVDTTGAGDGFVAALLSRLARTGAPPPEEWTAQALEEALRFACAVGSRVCTRLGAVAGLPRRDELAAGG